MIHPWYLHSGWADHMIIHVRNKMKVFSKRRWQVSIKICLSASKTGDLNTEDRSLWSESNGGLFLHHKQNVGVKKSFAGKFFFSTLLNYVLDRKRKKKIEHIKSVMYVNSVRTKKKINIFFSFTWNLQWSGCQQLLINILLRLFFS